MKNTAKPEYYIVPIKNLVIYSIFTLGVYQIYWFYRNWRAIEISEGREIYSYVRAFFSLIFSFFLFQRIFKDIGLDNKNSSIKALFLWIIYILMGFLGSIISWAISKSNIVLPGNTEIILSMILPILLSLSNIIIFIPVQNSINRYSFTNKTIDKSNIIQDKTNSLSRFVFLTILAIIFIYFLFGTILSTTMLFLLRDSYMGQTDYMKYENINFSSNIVFLNPLDKSEALDFINKLGYKEEKVEFIVDNTEKISEIKLTEDLVNKKIEELNNIRSKDDMRVFRYIYKNKLKSDKTISKEDLTQERIEEIQNLI